MPKKKMFLVDGSNHAFRVQFALPPMHASDGFPTRVLYGFTLLFQKMLRLYRPDYAVVSFDSGKTFRHDTYAEYKGHRPDMPEDLKRQWDYLPDLVQGFGFPVVMVPGFEADDVLGTLAHRYAIPVHASWGTLRATSGRLIGTAFDSHGQFQIGDIEVTPEQQPNPGRCRVAPTQPRLGVAAATNHAIDRALQRVVLLGRQQALDQPLPGLGLLAVLGRHAHARGAEQ